MGIDLASRFLQRDLGVSRNTIARYRVWARRHGLLAGSPLPDPAALATRNEARQLASELSGVSETVKADSQRGFTP